MADSVAQNRAMRVAAGALELRFQERVDVFVACDLLLYYKEFDNRKVVAPDVFVVLGVQRWDRTQYLLWEEGTAPQWVLEVASVSTHLQDLRQKRELYEELGVREYWQFDPTGDTLGRRLGRRLRGLELRGGRYVELIPGEGGVLPSAVLGLEGVVDGKLLRFRDPVTGLLIPTAEEAERARREEARRRREAEQARREAERRRHEAEQAQREAERRRHEAEQAQREAERRRHEAEQARREEARRRQELEAQLAALRAKPGQ